MDKEHRLDPCLVAKTLSSTTDSTFPDLDRDVVVVFDREPKKILICSSKTDEATKKARFEIFNHIRSTYNCVLMVHDSFIPSVEPESDKLWGRVYKPTSGASTGTIYHDANEPNHCQLDTEDVELVIAIGGDGTILKVIKMFPYVMPPIIGLSMGSMGYMAKFNMKQVKETLAGITTEGVTVSRRRLLHVEIYSENGELIARRNALNECVVDRGMSTSIATLDVYYQGSHFTTVTGDGLLISTPSGSTAYSMSAGGPIVHPSVPSILFTVICPHSISYRPVVLPSYAVLDVIVPADNRSSMRLSVDGNYHCNLNQGCHVKVSMSAVAFPMALPNNTCTGEEWNRALKEHLHWNVRVRQQVLQQHTRIYNQYTEQRFNQVT